MTVDHPFQNDVENETSYVWDHMEQTNMVNMGGNTGLFGVVFRNFKLHCLVEKILNTWLKFCQ